ncbi:DNA-binding protein [Salmonella enterica]|uniref:DNA-binding protein n=1 Tax=Escherichia coli TaxID=562 RepID=UPI00138188EE|nr:DNA-binding protein [Escherichia coli]EBU4479842.1 DNA-binding protein [Salmonella enterica]HBM2629942.1 DNA-binding protein [Enterobacter hormaechei subsp. hoffmannii]EDZ8034522.1 DNA-binding protein [Salmonella enterica]EEL0893033.1 DNA-binding protein [Salmonella enterica]EFQ6391185.1 DNA-binding protein [Salmonella enterica]
MNNIILFKSKKQLTAENNYNEFIKFCRYQLSGLTQTQDWEQYVWKGYVTFRKIGVGHKVFNSKDAMHEDFLDFAKAYIRYQHSLKPLKNYGAIMMALRCLEQALLQVLSNALIYNVTAVVFDEAMQIGSRHFEGNVLAQCGIQLEKLSKFLCEHNLVKSGYISWKNHVKQKVKNNYLPEMEDYHRNDKLPDETALLAIADIFSKNDELLSPRDKFTSAVFALLLCCPSRISEILALPADCEITQKDERGVERYGLRFYSVKGYGPNIKWIPQVMIPVAKKAIRRLLSLSQNARELAQWCEKYPDKFYRHELCPKVDEKLKLTVVQVCHALGYPLHDRKSCVLKIKRTSLDGGKSFLNSNDYNYSLSELWEMISSGFSRDFPWYDEEKSIRYSNALCLLNPRQFSLSQMSDIYSFYKPTKGFFFNDIQNKIRHESGFKNIFARYGYYDIEGKPLLIRSHQPRHLLNTIAHYGEMSELDIAKWSGRVNVNQNRVYNHVSEEDMLDKIKTIKLNGSNYCQSETIPTNELTIDFDNLNQGAIHLTEFGCCVHNYLVKPCAKMNQFVECDNETLDMKSVDRIRLQSVREKIMQLKRITKIAYENGDYGADKWLQHHEKNLERINKLLNN